MDSSKAIVKENPAIDYSKHFSHFSGARFIVECGKKLKANAITIGLAASYYHKFFETSNLEDYDIYLIGATCVYLASKVYNDDIKIRDIINVAISCVRCGEPPLSLDPYFTMRDSLIQTELLLMRVLDFNFCIELPHKYLLHYLNYLEDWLTEKTFDEIPIVQCCWTLLLDAYHGQFVVKYPPEYIALAIINLVLFTYGITVPGNDPIGKPWYSILNPGLQPDCLWEIIHKLVHLYEEEKNLILFEKSIES